MTPDTLFYLRIVTCLVSAVVGITYLFWARQLCEINYRLALKFRGPLKFCCPAERYTAKSYIWSVRVGGMISLCISAFILSVIISQWSLR